MFCLRKFPYPYQAMLAISSDVDNTPALDNYLELMKFFNTAADTRYGRGIDLEVGNSFWFFNTTDRYQLSYYNGTSDTATEFAAYCRRLIESGHIDTIHSYGNFDTGGFDRRLAEKAITELQRNGLQVPVWINHGTGNNNQNIGFEDGYTGALPGSNAYHADLLSETGIRYLWTGNLTHVPGQDGDRTLALTAIDWAQKINRFLKYRNVTTPLFDEQNRLMFPLELQDGQFFWGFQRWINLLGRTTLLDINDLVFQTTPTIMRLLVRNRGYMVLYTHFCEGSDLSLGLPPILKKNLRYIQKLVNKRDLLVTTTARLLRYNEISSHLECNLMQTDDGYQLIIPTSLKLPIGDYQLTEVDLEGLTFYISHPEKTTVIFNNKVLPTVLNPADESGRLSRSIPWKPLHYPF